MLVPPSTRPNFRVSAPRRYQTEVLAKEGHRDCAALHAADVLGLDALGTLTARSGSQHAPHEVVIVLVAIGLKVEVGGHLGQPLVADALDVFLHEAVVIAPTDAGRTHRRLLGAGGDLMGVQIVQVELVDQGPVRSVRLDRENSN